MLDGADGACGVEYRVGHGLHAAQELMGTEVEKRHR